MTGLYDGNVENAREKAVDALAAIAALEQLVTSVTMDTESSVDNMSYTTEKALKDLNFLKEQLNIVSKGCRTNINSALSFGSHHERNEAPPPNMDVHRKDPFSEYENRALMQGTGDVGTIPPAAMALMRLRVGAAILAAEELLAANGDCYRERALETMWLLRGLLNIVSDKCLLRIDDTVTKISHR